LVVCFKNQKLIPIIFLYHIECEGLVITSYILLFSEVMVAAKKAVALLPKSECPVDFSQVDEKCMCENGIEDGAVILSSEDYCRQEATTE